MKKEDFYYKETQLKVTHENEMVKLRKEYAFGNNPHKLGDIITDHIGSIKIERIEMASVFGSDLPSCKYYGPILKKDLTPKVNGDKRYAWQSNLNKI